MPFQQKEYNEPLQRAQFVLYRNLCMLVLSSRRIFTADGTHKLEGNQE